MSKDYDIDSDLDLSDLYLWPIDSDLDQLTYWNCICDLSNFDWASVDHDL